MDLVKMHDALWHVFPRGQSQETGHLRGEIHLDRIGQVEALVLRDCAPEERLAIKRLACSHMAQYVRNRTVSNGIFVVEHRNPHLTAADSDAFMSFGRIPEGVQALGEEALNAALERHIHAVEATYPSCTEAVIDAVLRVRMLAGGQDGAGLNIISAERHAILDRISILFGVPADGPRKFRFWKDLYPESDLHVIPPYHPVRHPERIKAGLINGDTDALITREDSGIYSIHCPLQAAVGTDLFGSWKTKHPFFAEGHEIRMEIDPLLFQTRSACDLLAKILIATLELDDTYMPVSGGFSPPHDRFRRGSRGSEEMAAWEYRTLEREGKLEGAIVPPWLEKEGWLKRLPKEDVAR